MFKFRDNIKAITPYTPGKPVKEVERELGIRNSIKLASNENAWGFSPKAKEAMEEAIKEANIYPDGNSYYLRKEIAAFNNVHIDNVIAGNGSNEVLEIVMRTVLAKGCNVVSSQYAFAIYRLITEIADAEYRETKAKDHRFDAKAIMAACDQNTAIIVVDNPNNPTGTYIPFNEMLELLEFAEKNNILLIADEAYWEYVRAKDYKSMMSVWGKYKNLVVSRTFSKVYGLCGLRIGYAIANEEVIKYANIVREPFNVNLVAQHAAIAAMEDQTFVKDVVQKTHEGMDYLGKELKAAGLNHLDSQCNFMLVEVPCDGKEFFNKLLKLGVIVRPMGGYGLNNFLRLTIGTTEQNKKAVEAIRQVLDDSRC
jgi:histidinol-phosphate aminotransferase